MAIAVKKLKTDKLPQKQAILTEAFGLLDKYLPRAAVNQAISNVLGPSVVKHDPTITHAYYNAVSPIIEREHERRKALKINKETEARENYEDEMKLEDQITRLETILKMKHDRQNGIFEKIAEMKGEEYDPHTHDYLDDYDEEELREGLQSLKERREGPKIKEFKLK